MGEGLLLHKVIPQINGKQGARITREKCRSRHKISGVHN